jgi:ribosome biogenesis GTPase
VVEAVDPRRSLLYRSTNIGEASRRHATQMVIVLAAVPSFYEDLLNRCPPQPSTGGIA